MKILVLYLFEALMLFVLTIFFSEINKNVLEAQSKLKERFNKNKHKLCAKVRTIIRSQDFLSQF